MVTVSPHFAPWGGFHAITHPVRPASLFLMLCLLAIGGCGGDVPPKEAADKPDGLAESYLDQDDGRVIFRRPKGLTPALARRVVRRAKAEVGAKFDTAELVAEGLGGTFLGHLVNSLFGDKPKELVAGLLHEKGRWVCSDLVIYCFREEPKYRGKGAVAKPVGTVSPQTLFEDEELFDPLPR
jgi:hypothetical protein